MTRTTAILVWAALLLVPLAFMAVASTVANAESPRLVQTAFWLAVGASALNVVLSRVLPPLLGPARASDRDAIAFIRMTVALALCEAAAIAPLVAYIVARDPRLFGVLALDLMALVILFPSEGRWASFLPEPNGAPEKRRTIH